MSESIQVVVSGAVGKQVRAAADPVRIQSVVLDAPTSASTLTVRDGNASGDVRLTMSSPVGDTNQVKLGDKRFDRGLHVKVIGQDAKAYLIIK